MYFKKHGHGHEEKNGHSIRPIKKDLLKTLRTHSEGTVKPKLHLRDDNNGFCFVWPVMYGMALYNIKQSLYRNQHIYIRISRNYTQTWKKVDELNEK